MSVNNPISYEVYITPLIDRNVYGDVVDVTSDINITESIKDGGISKIKREIDNGDYEVGVFVYGDITLTALNYDGKFNQPDDSRSIFRYTRDKAKIYVKFTDTESDTSISFKGIINEEGSKQDFAKHTVKFKVLSLDSAIRKTKVSSGTISNGMSFSSAIKNIINVPDITAVLNYNASYINVDLDLTIDDGSWFDNKPTKEALDALMVVSNSVMVIDSDDYMIVRSRSENTKSIFNFYGEGDLFGRENIIKLTNYNSGLHRSFNSIIYDNIEVGDSALVAEYGSRQKKIDYPFITNDLKKQQIANNILTEFKVQKTELEIDTPTEVAKELNLFDLVAINNPYCYIPYENNKLPIYGASTYGTGVYPIIRGDLKIMPSLAWKVMGFEENPKDFETTIKLRQRGITLSDGMFAEFITLYGTAVYSEDEYQEDINLVDPNYNSVYGAAVYGTVHYGSIL